MHLTIHQTQGRSQGPQGIFWGVKIYFLASHLLGQLIRYVLQALCQKQPPTVKV